MLKSISLRKLSGIVFVILILSLASCQSSDVLSSLRMEITQYVDTLDAEVGVAVLTQSGDSLTVNNQIHYPMMSVFKFHQSIAVADYLAQHQLPLSTEIEISQKDVSLDTYSPLRDKYPNGEVQMSVADLLKYTLQRSDNIACDILFDRFYSPQQIDSVLRAKMKIQDFVIVYNEAQMHADNQLGYDNWSTPYATVELLSKFINDSIVAEPYQSFIKQMMVESQTGQSRLPNPMKNTNAIIGHKTGSGFTTSDGRLSAINDVGFVELPNGMNYTVAVYIKDANLSFEECEKIISDISGMIYYDFNVKLYQ